ncbi:MAG: hypothetical protein ACKO2Z_00640 [Sphaerospermopsis kisseleviana]
MNGDWEEIFTLFFLTPDSCTGVREACWKHQHSGDKLSIFITGYFLNASPLRLLTPKTSKL